MRGSVGACYRFRKQLEYCRRCRPRAKLRQHDFGNNQSFRLQHDPLRKYVDYVSFVLIDSRLGARPPPVIRALSQRAGERLGILLATAEH